MEQSRFILGQFLDTLLMLKVEASMSSANTRLRPVQPGSVAAHLRICLIASWACGWTFLTVGAVVEFLTDTHPALLPAALTDYNVHRGFMAVGTGCFALAVWLQAVVSNMLYMQRVPHTRSWWSAALNVIFVVIALLLLATSLIPLIVLLSSPASSPLYDTAVKSDSVAIFANFGWGTVGLLWWAIQRSTRNSRAIE